MNPLDPQAASLPARVLGLCLLRGGPQDLPFSPALLVALLVASITLDAGIGNTLAVDARALERALLSTLVILGLCWATLALRDQRHRFVQTATAIIATGIVFTLLQATILLVLGNPPVAAPHLTPAQALVAWLLLAVFLWQLTVTAHIVRHATELRSGMALALVAAWIALWWMAESVAFGAPGS